jgi:hypothetical protein
MPDDDGVVSIDELDKADLRVGALYGGMTAGRSVDPLSRLLKVGVQGGIRGKGSPTTDNMQLVALYSTGMESEWPDRVDDDSGILTYFGDNRGPGRDLLDTSLRGNLIFRNAFDAAAGSVDDRLRVPPFFYFERVDTRGPIVRFRGLAVPGVPGRGAVGSLNEIIHDVNGVEVRNYEAKFTILSDLVISRQWIEAILAGEPSISNGCPRAWREWAERGVYRSIASPDERLVIPAIVGDDAQVTDMLDIDNDALAVAAVVTTRQVDTPLTVALYGPWGSGKSYFMRRIEHHIGEFANSEVSVFESKVGHVKFKPWHYERGHLVASLHRQIFETLNVEGPDRDVEIKEADRRIEKQIEKVEVARRELLSAQVAESSFEKNLAIIEGQQDDILSLVRSMSLADVEDTVPEGLLDDVGEVLKELGLPALGYAGRDLKKSVDDIFETAGQIPRLLTAGRTFLNSPLFRGVAAAAVVFAVLWVVDEFVPWVIGDIGASVQWFSSIVMGVGVTTAAVSDKMKELLSPARRLLQVLERVAARKSQAREKLLESLQADLRLRKEAVADADRKLTDARRDLELEREKRDELEPSVILEKYIAERAATTEYDAELGVVARLHRDLYNLSDALIAAIDDDRTRINRVVLYIDDLDRCSPDTVFAVLEALHLFLSLPHFITIVGVDPRSLSTSVRKLRPGFSARKIGQFFLRSMWRRYSS